MLTWTEKNIRNFNFNFFLTLNLQKKIRNSKFKKKLKFSNELKWIVNDVNMNWLQVRCICTAIECRARAQRPAASVGNSLSNCYLPSRECAISTSTPTRKTTENGNSSTLITSLRHVCSLRCLAITTWHPLLDLQSYQVLKYTVQLKS